MNRINISRTGSITIYTLLILLIQQSCKKKDILNVPVVTISSISKNLLNIGDTLIIKGSHFDPDPSKNLVAVATVSYQVIQASSDQLSVVVPKAAQSGTLSIGFAGGKAAQFSQPITIIGATQPVIVSIAPATAYEGDTIVVTGKNFAIPYDVNSITFNGTQVGKIINATSTELRVIIPDLSDSGPVQVTTNGQTSVPYDFTIAKMDPMEDGQLYWLALYYDLSDIYNGPGEMTHAFFNKGTSNRGLPQSSVLFSYDGTLFPRYTPSYLGKFTPYMFPHTIFSFVVSDQQHNAYYLTSTAEPFPAEYHLMKIPYENPSGPVSVWSQAFDAPGTFTEVRPDFNPSNYPAVQIPYTPLQPIAMDGNTIYLKMGTTDDYYTGDVSQPSPALTLEHHVLGDSTAYALQFSKDYVFYFSSSLKESYETSPVDSLWFSRKGSKIPERVSIPLQQYADNFVSILADASHGNEVLIVTRGYDANISANAQKIWNFNADTKALTLLYDGRNWADAAYPEFSQYDFTEGNTGFLWVGHHIYYACTKSVENASTLHRIDDDGHSSRPITIYGRMEPMTTNQALRFNLFIGK